MHWGTNWYCPSCGKQQGVRGYCEECLENDKKKQINLKRRILIAKLEKGDIGPQIDLEIYQVLFTKDELTWNEDFPLAINIFWELPRKSLK